MILRRAFTLAEILIALGIVGVVAALTIPVLVEKHQKKVFATKVKQTYAIVSNALITSVAENGPPSEWDFGQPVENNGSNVLNTPEAIEKMAIKYFVPYLQNCKHALKDNFYYILLSNGTTLTFRTDGNITNGIYTPETLYILASFNGNISQYWDASRNYSKSDVIMLVSVTQNNTKLRFFNWGGNTRSGIINEPRYGCNKEVPANLRYGCGALIQYDGWEIKDDFPW